MVATGSNPISPTETVVIVNPASAGGATAKRWPAIVKELTTAGLDHRTLITAAAGDATNLTRNALCDGAELVMVIGGDGTLNEVVNGFFDETGEPLHPQAALSIIPSGTGRDFAQSLPL